MAEHPSRYLTSDLLVAVSEGGAERRAWLEKVNKEVNVVLAKHGMKELDFASSMFERDVIAEVERLIEENLGV